MKKTFYILLAVFICVSLASCRRTETQSFSTDVSASEQQEPEVEAVSEEQASPIAGDSITEDSMTEDSDEVGQALDPDKTYVYICGEPVEITQYGIVEPEIDIDVYSMKAGDFGSFFEDEYPVTRESYKICEGRKTETTVTHIHSENPGPCVYVIAGIHGDEVAAWYAGLLLQEVSITSGDLYVMAPANAAGAKVTSRYADALERVDPNRVFPGDPDGSVTEVLAHEIFSDVQRVMPDFVFDLHEAIIYKPEERDFLGSTFIFTELDGIEDLFFGMLFDTQDGTLCHNEFGYNGPGPAGSINATITRQLGIPTITVETFRGFDISRRVSDQLDTVNYVLEFYGMR